MSDLVSTSLYLFVEFDIFCILLLMLTFIFSTKLFRKNKWTVPIEVVLATVFIVLTLISEMVFFIGQYRGNLSNAVNYTVLSVYYCSIAAAAASYEMYIYNRLIRFKRKFTVIQAVIWIPTILIAALSITAFKNELLCAFTSEGKYVRGTFFYLYSGIQLAYYIIGLWITLRIYFKNKSDADAYLSLGLAIYAIPNIVFFLLQIFHGFNTYSAGISVASVAFAVSMIYGQSKKNQRMKEEEKAKVEAVQAELNKVKEYSEYFLVGHYSCFYVDLDTHKYTVFKGRRDKFTWTEDFFELMERYCKEVFCGEDGMSVLNVLKPEVLRSIIIEKKEHMMIVRDANKKQPRFVMLHIARGEDDNHVALGFIDVDDLVKRRGKEQRRLDQSHQIIEMLGGVVEARNLESGEHIQRVKHFTRILAEDMLDRYKEYNLDYHKVELIVSASALHDVGKIMIRDNILLKPDKLTSEEFETMKTHTTIGCEIVKKTMKGVDEEYYKYCYEIARYHHEKYDGKGYPEGLKGEEIPIAAQLVSVADVFDALTSKRVYKDAYSLDEAYNMILKGECGQFSSKLLDCFKNTKDSLFAMSKSMKSDEQGELQSVKM